MKDDNDKLGYIVLAVTFLAAGIYVLLGGRLRGVLALGEIKYLMGGLFLFVGGGILLLIFYKKNNAS